MTGGLNSMRLVFATFNAGKLREVASILAGVPVELVSPADVGVRELPEETGDTFLENAYNIDRKLLLDRNELAKRHGDPQLREVELYRAIRPGEREHFNAGSYLFFERAALMSMYEAGRRAASERLAAGPLRDGRNLPE